MTVAVVRFLLPSFLLFSCDGSRGDSDGGHDDGANSADGDGGDGGQNGGDGGSPSDGVEKQCGELMATLRDFRADHPDMQENIASDLGIVETMLGVDQKPIYAHDGATTTVSGPESFDQWYRDVKGVNLTFEQGLPLVETSPGVYVFEDSEFFPLDGKGWPGEEIGGHNFHFTTEIHASFRYRGGEVFTFTGDDDVFIFVNRRLALDLGGVHGELSSTVDFDAQAADLGIEVGNIYNFDAFHAERHTTESNFRVETSIDCFIID